MRLMEPPDGRPWLLIGLFTISVALNVVLVSMLWGESAGLADPSDPDPEVLVETDAAEVGSVGDMEDPEAQELEPEPAEPKIDSRPPAMRTLRGGMPTGSRCLVAWWRARSNSTPR